MPMMPTYDFETEADAIKRKQAIADAMQASALRPMEMPTQPGVKVSPIAVLGKMLEGYVANKRQDALKDERTALSQRYGDELKSGMEQYYKTMQGYETPSMALAPNEDGSPQMVKVPGDRKKAIFDALASNHPVLRDLAMSQLKEEGKDQLTPKDLLSIATPESVLANPANPAAWKPKRDLKAFAPGEVLLDSSGNYATPGNPSGQQPFGLKTIGGDLYQTSATGYKKLDNAPKVTVNNAVNMGDNALMKKLGESTAELIDGARKGKQQAQQTQFTANRLEELNNKGVFSGPTANIATTLGAFAQTLGVPVDQNKLGRSEEYNAILAQQVSKVLTAGNGVGRSMTDEDRKRFEAQFPQLISTPKGRQQIIGMLRDSAAQDMQYANQVEANLRKNYPEAARLWDVAPTNVGFPTPAKAKAGVPGPLPPVTPAKAGVPGPLPPVAPLPPIPLDQYLKNFGGR